MSYEEAERNDMIIEYSPMVKYIAYRVHSSLPDNAVEMNDLINTGIIGLIDAISKFDPKRGISFKYYAEMRIKGEIIDSLRQMDWLPKSVRKLQKDIDRAVCSLQATHGRVPDNQEIADYLKIPLNEYHKILYKTKGMSIGHFSEWSSENFSDPILKTTEDHRSPDPVKLIQKKELLETLEKELEKLSQQEKLVLSLYYYNELTLKEIGNVLDISESRVSQIRTKILFKIRKNLLLKNLRPLDDEGVIING